MGWLVIELNNQAPGIVTGSLRCVDDLVLAFNKRYFCVALLSYPHFLAGAAVWCGWMPVFFGALS